MTHSSLDIIHDLENYLSSNALDAMVKEMMVACLKDRPEEPLSWMMKYILQKNKGVGTGDCAVASASDQSAYVAVSHADAATQQYLSDKKVHQLFMELLQQIVKEKPDNVLSFAATTAHNLHKNPPPGLQ